MWALVVAQISDEEHSFVAPVCRTPDDEGICDIAEAVYLAPPDVADEEAEQSALSILAALQAAEAAVGEEDGDAGYAAAP